MHIETKDALKEIAHLKEITQRWESEKQNMTAEIEDLKQQLSLERAARAAESSLLNELQQQHYHISHSGVRSPGPSISLREARSSRLDHGQSEPIEKLSTNSSSATRHEPLKIPGFTF